MTEAQIKMMVDRFLSWRLPEDFAPDAGITFTPMFNEHTPHPMRHEPSGTNLLNASQAEAMVRHMLAEPVPLTDVQRSVRDGTFGVRSASEDNRAAYRAAVDNCFRVSDREIDKAMSRRES